jgi:CheY-like chemotaxis protein
MFHSSDTAASEPLAAAPCRRVLVIDDSRLIREAAKVALGTIGGWLVSTAASGEEGLTLAAAERPDAILLDVVMPGIDGIDAAERLQEKPSTRSLPIVLLTASDQATSGQRLRHAHVAGVISKPFDVATLSAQLAALLGWPA